jgi:hypothetical protein
MLMPMKFREPIARGEITLTYRRWKKLQVVVGNRYRTAAGRLQVDKIDIVADVSRITQADAKRAGFESKEAILKFLRGDEAVPVYRIRFHPVEGPDERSELAADDALQEADVAEISRRLERLDRASSWGAWTHDTLRVIHQQPAVLAAELAASFGRETQPFKLDVRKLKGLGLTISLPKGYELSPRGEAYLRAIDQGS